MRLPITEGFLWAIYDLLEIGDEIFDAVFLSYPRSLRESVTLSKLRRRYARKKARKGFSQFIYSLKKKGYIKVRNIEGKKGVLLTKKGLEKVLKTKFKMIEKKRRKDKKWLMLMFDIPERQRRLRNLFREYLQELGFKMLQKSVWACPFDVLKEVETIIRKHTLEPYIKIFLIEEVEI